MKIEIREFNQLSLEELYQVLQLRSEVFVVEQNCVYQDLDGKDYMALHILGFENDLLVAYTRCFKPGDYFENASIGRVIVRDNFRKYGYGHQVMKASIKEIENRYNTYSIRISAQQYLKNFYETHGFKPSGEGYLEDGIPHIAMIRE